MRMERIADVTSPVSTWHPRREPAREFDYVDLSAVDSSTKAVTGATRLLGSDAPSRARQLIATDDVLVSTVRPNLNAVAAVPIDLDGATASTGFSVLRPAATVDPRYLFHWVQSQDFITDMVRKATGASYPAVSDRIVRISLIPLPPLPEQRRIAAILDHADALRTRRRQALAHLDSLTQAIFHDMFDDPDRLTATVAFGAVADLAGGRNLVADDSTIVSPFRVLKISAVTSGQFKPAESKPLPPDYQPPHGHLVRADDLLMSRANTAELVGAVAHVPPSFTEENMALPDKVWKFVWKVDAEPSFYHALFGSPAMRRRISGLSSGTGGSMKNVSKAKLTAMPVPSIDIDRQREFVTRSQAVAHLRESVQRSLTADDELFASLQSRAFRGEL